MSRIFAIVPPLIVAILAGTALADDATVAITSQFSSGPGSIREVIEKANASKAVTRIVSTLAPGTIVRVFRQLPALAAPGLDFDAGGLTLQGGTCIRPDGRRGCDGIVITGPDVHVRRLRATGFTFDGIAVRGPDAKRVRIEECEAFANGDDGIGVSQGATDVVVEHCKLERNGFRTKGKGILVFEYATAELIANVVRYNRDGVTVSRHARAQLVGNQIAENYDKGLGVAGAEASGRDNVIERNGRGGPDGREPGPNADGVRVSLDSKLTLVDTQVLDNGDTGIVVLDASTVDWRGGRISGHRGPGISARDHATVELHGVTIENNQGGEFRLDGEAKLVRDAPR
jgi:Right handed beta helix region